MTCVANVFDKLPRQGDALFETSLHSSCDRKRLQRLGKRRVDFEQTRKFLSGAIKIAREVKTDAVSPSPNQINGWSATIRPVSSTASLVRPKGMRYQPE